MFFHVKTLNTDISVLFFPEFLYILWSGTTDFLQTCKGRVHFRGLWVCFSGQMSFMIATIVFFASTLY